MTNAEHNKKGIILALKTLLATTPYSRKELASLVSKVESNSISTLETESELKKIRASQVLEQEKERLKNRLIIEQLKKDLNRFSKSPSYPKHNKEKIIESATIKDNDISASLEFLISLHRMTSENLISARESSPVISKKSENIISGDIHWASKQIIKSFSPLILRLKNQHSDNKRITDLHERSLSLRSSKEPDFFAVISFMEACMVEVTKVSQKVNEAESNALFAFQGHLEDMHSKLSTLISKSSSFNQDKEKEKLNEISNRFKKLSMEESDPMELRKIISSNVTNMNSCFEEIINNQESHIRKVNRNLSKISLKIEEHKEEIKKLSNEKSNLSEINKSLKKASTIDELTNSKNRRAYESHALEIDKLIKDKESSNELCGVIVMDLDNFKKLNDTHGHLVGDKVLTNFSKTIEKIIKAKKISKRASLYRYGGEEFVLLYQNIGIRGAITLAELCRKVFENSSYKINNKTIKCTVSIGVSSIPLKGRVEDAFSLSDKALYRAKGEGRNSVVLHHNGRYKALQKS